MPLTLAAVITSRHCSTEVSGATIGLSSPVCIASATRVSSRRPRLPPGWMAAKSSLEKPRACMTAMASASPRAIIVTAEAVGASPSGQASHSTEESITASDWLPSVELRSPQMAIRPIPLRLSAGKICDSSSVSPLLESMMTTSPSTTIPRSPWIASAGCMKKAGVPVLANVPVSLRPTAPDLPMPQSTARPDISSSI